MILVHCPHCSQLIEIESINCAIFRCGIYRTTGQQVSPHAPKAECDRLAAEQQIWGCGKPFRLVREAASATDTAGPSSATDTADPSGWKAEACEYI